MRSWIFGKWLNGVVAASTRW